jgi:hypothetical protein
MIVYEVVCNTGHGWRVTGLFDSIDKANAQVERDITWVEKYHGPYYPVKWEEPKLAPERRTWRSTPYQGDIEIRERELS